MGPSHHVAATVREVGEQTDGAREGIGDARRAANRAVLERAISLIGTGEYAALGGLYADDYILELPYSDPPKRLEGRREIAEYVGPQLGTFVFTLMLTAVHDCVDPDLLIAEYTSDGHVSTTGKTYRNTYIALWRFRDGKVCGVKEFSNPMVAAEALDTD
jgi:ketosteroid isomerase-like protein